MFALGLATPIAGCGRLNPLFGANQSSGASGDGGGTGSPAESSTGDPRTSASSASSSSGRPGDDANDGNPSSTSGPDDPTSTTAGSSSSGALTPDLQPVCGDGIVQGDETCDDENTNNNDECVEGCVDAACGDGWRHEGFEDCDDGNLEDGDACSSACEESLKYVFATSELYNGDLDGLEGADEICNTLASEAGLPGTYLAWLSDSAQSPSTRFEHASIPYARVDLTVIASNWDDLIDGELAAPISLDEFGDPTPIGTMTCDGTATATSIWTGTEPDGSAFPFTIEYCDDWTSSDGTENGHWGVGSLTNVGWSSACVGGGQASPGCAAFASLYCFQQ